MPATTPVTIDTQKADCPVKSVRADEIEEGVLDYLFGSFLDEPAFNKAVERAMPSADHRKGLEEEREQAIKRLAKNQREIDRLIDAIRQGADAGLLLFAQDTLKAEKEAVTKRIEELSAEISNLPDVAQTERAAMMTRFCLMLQYRERDWRTMPYEDVKRFLLYLFG